MSKEELREQFRGETFKNTTEKYLGGHQHYSDDYVEWLESKLTTKQESVTDDEIVEIIIDNSDEKLVDDINYYTLDYQDVLEVVKDLRSKLTIKQESVTDESLQALDNLLENKAQLFVKNHTPLAKYTHVERLVMFAKELTTKEESVTELECVESLLSITKGKKYEVVGVEFYVIINDFGKREIISSKYFNPIQSPTKH